MRRCYSQAMDVTHIECRHAALRRILRGRAQTHCFDFETSAAFFLFSRERQRFARWVQRPDASAAAAGQPVPAAGRKKQKQTWSGGAQRAFMSTYLKGKCWKSRQDRRDTLRAGNAEYNRIKTQDGREHARLQELGRAATIAARFGGLPFGHLRKRLAFSMPDPLRQLPKVLWAAASGSSGAASGSTATSSGAAPVPSGVPGAQHGSSGAASGSSSEASAQMAIILASDAAANATVVFSESRRKRARDCLTQLVQLAPEEKHKQQKTCELAKRRHDQLATWAQSHPRDLQEIRQAPPANLLGGQPCPSLNNVMDIVHFNPPLKAMAERALSGNARSDETLAAAAKALQSAWQERCKLIRHEEVPKITQVGKSKTSRCFLAGICLCDDGGKQLDFLVAKFEKLLKNLLCKGAPARALYDKGALVLALRPAEIPEGGSDEANPQVWWHVGYGNLNSSMFTGLLLEACAGARARAVAAHGMVALKTKTSPADELCTANVWQLLRDMHARSRVEIEAFCLVSSNELHYQVTPGLQVLVKPFTPQIVECLELDFQPPLLLPIIRPPLADRADAARQGHRGQHLQGAPSGRMPADDVEPAEDFEDSEAGTDTPVAGNTTPVAVAGRGTPIAGVATGDTTPVAVAGTDAPPTPTGVGVFAVSAGIWDVSCSDGEADFPALRGAGVASSSASGVPSPPRDSPGVPVEATVALPGAPRQRQGNLSYDVPGGFIVYNVAAKVLTRIARILVPLIPATLVG